MDSAPSTPVDGTYLQALVQDTLAAFQIAEFFTWGLHGILLVQLYNYYLSFPKDPITRKLIVYLVFILETIQLGLVAHDTYHIFTAGLGDIMVINDLQLLPLTIPILGGIIGMTCHLMFAYRIMMISKSKIMSGVIGLLAVCSAIASFVFGARLFQAGNLTNVITDTPTIYIVCSLWNGFGAACDVLIAVFMTYYLSRSPTGFRKTDLLITRIIRLTIETGAFTATASIASAILFVGYRKNARTNIFFVVPAVALAKMYSVTILATFNNRPDAVGGPPAISDVENSFDVGGKGGVMSSRQNAGKEIRIGRTVVQQVWRDAIPLSHIDVYKSELEA